MFLPLSIFQIHSNIFQIRFVILFIKIRLSNSPLECWEIALLKILLEIGRKGCVLIALGKQDYKEAS